MDNFWPLCASRPPYLLRCGATLLWEKWVRRLRMEDVYFFCRRELAETLAERTSRPVNQMDDWAGADIWVLDGRWLIPSGRNPNPDEFPATCRLVCAGRTIGLRLNGENIESTKVHDWLRRGGTGDFPDVELETYNVSGKIVDYLWDIVDYNPEQIAVDFEFLAAEKRPHEPQARIDAAAVLQRPEQIHFGPGVQIGPLAVLNAEGGPIIIGEKATIDPYTYIEGPAVIGGNSGVFGGKIRAGTTIGPGCRVGGEVEASVFLGWANKHHDGFLGHSVIGEWVNLGAMTANSDLKNNYGPIRVAMPGKTVDTGRIKVGSFLADYTKTGIGTLIPTGGTVGFAGNIFGGGNVAPKYIPEFVWGGGNAFDEHRLAQAKQTAARVCNRRNVDFTEAQARLFDVIFAQSKKYREMFLKELRQ